MQKQVKKLGRALLLTQPLEHVEPDDRPTNERRCIATGESGGAHDFVRFVLSPDGVVTPDLTGKLPGRGAWVSANRLALDEAVKKSAFARSFKAAAQTPDGLSAIVEVGLAKRALSALGLARRTGDAVVGFEKTKAALKASEAAVLVSASDGAEDGKAKLRGAGRNVAVVGFFTGAELSSALGRDHVVHLAVKKGVSAVRFLAAARRLEGFRTHLSG